MRNNLLKNTLSALSLSLLILTALGCSANSDKSGSREKITIQAGKLSEHLNEIAGKDVYIYKKDGTLDDRPNDLEELCKDYDYYRKKILEYAQAGNELKAAECRQEFQKVNAWIDEYHESDSQAMFGYIGLL